MRQHIEVWYDEASGDEPKWCVSLCEDDGEEVKCLATRTDRDHAIARGQVAAAKRGIKMLIR